MTDTAAEDQLLALARELFGDVQLARAAESDDELELAVFNVRPFGRNQRVGKSGKVVHEQVRGYEENRAGIYGGMEHPGDLGEHFVHGDPSHMIHNVSEPEWVANEWKARGAAQKAWQQNEPKPSAGRKPKSAEQIADEVQTRTHDKIPPTLRFEQVGKHLDAATDHLLRRDQGEQAGKPDQDHAARAYHELLQAHEHLRSEMVPRATPEEYAGLAEHMQRIAGHMQDLDRAMGAKPESTRELLGSFSENFAHAGEILRTAETQRLEAKAEQAGSAAEEAKSAPAVSGASQLLPASRKGVLKEGDWVSDVDSSRPGTVISQEGNRVKVRWEDGRPSSVPRDQLFDETTRELERVSQLADLQQPKKGAAAVHPHLGTRHATPLAGDTMSGTAHAHVPRPFDVPPPNPDQAAKLKAEAKAQQAAEELAHQRGIQGQLRQEKQNAAVLERMGLPAPGTYRPLDDEEFTVHQKQLDDALEKAYKDGLTTDYSHTENGDGQTWEPDRASLHADILKDYLDQQVDVPSQRHAVVLGGLPGAGKSGLLKAKGVDPKDYAVVSADSFKEELVRRGMVPEIKGMSPMESSFLVHEESRHLANLALAELERRGKNVALEVTLNKEKPSTALIKDFKDHGYSVTGLLADVPAEVSADRAGRRYRSELESYRKGSNTLGGRYIPRYDLLKSEAQPGVTYPQRTFEKLKPQFDYWERWDGTQSPPKRVERAQQELSPSSGIPSVEEMQRQARQKAAAALDTEQAARAREKGTG